MAMTKAELVVHPLRLRIIQALGGEQLTASEISAALPEAPRSSIYRHLRLLLDGGMIRVVETRLVNGIQEKVYALAQSAYLRSEDVAGLSVEQHQQMFAIWVASAMQGFSDYLLRSAATYGRPNLAADLAGYTEVAVFATDEEMTAAFKAINDAFNALIGNSDRADLDSPRRKRKLATITHPLE